MGQLRKDQLLAKQNRVPKSRAKKAVQSIVYVTDEKYYHQTIDYLKDKSGEFSLIFIGETRKKSSDSNKGMFSCTSTKGDLRKDVGKLLQRQMFRCLKKIALDLRNALETESPEGNKTGMSVSISILF